MIPAHAEAVKSIKNAVANKAFLHSKKLISAYAIVVELVFCNTNQQLTTDTLHPRSQPVLR